MQDERAKTSRHASENMPIKVCPNISPSFHVAKVTTKYPSTIKNYEVGDPDTEVTVKQSVRNAPYLESAKQK